MGTLELSLINCEINLGLNWYKKCVIVTTNIVNQSSTYSITDTKLCVPVVTLSIHNAKLFEQFYSGFKSTINWNKYQSKISTERRSIFRLHNWFKFSRSNVRKKQVNKDFLFYHIKMKHNEQVINDIIFQL